MIKPPLPANECVRLDMLRALKILDTTAEERFDRVTRLAKRLFEVPMSLVSLIDADRQWFKSNIGLKVLETSRDISFCGHAILGDDVFSIRDTELDERFFDNPLVKNGPKIRFYAGCPIKAADGSKVGTLCILDVKPRNFTDEDKSLLKDLTLMVEQEIAAVQLATMDSLTSISNRRGFEALCMHALRFCTRQKKPATLFFFDLTRFKEINDRFGHAEGDRALVSFSELLMLCFRETDVIGRIGGDEFAVLLTSSDKEESELVLARFSESVAKHNESEERGYNITYDVGIVEYNQSLDKNLEEFIDKADKLMYENKRLKKNEL
ncbi:sensor domain-containing diguanylate cyclase [Herbaspirillum rhizosphaerae]|uniref:Sensor domain-containing diguanylate cyclase n=1 Tax=Herbaspirillum rhizosphaerae TaxID=346179 RepID=A0ABW8ZHE7_9BURK